MRILRAFFLGHFKPVFLLALFFVITPLFLIVARTTRGRLAGLAGVISWASFIAIMSGQGDDNYKLGLVLLLVLVAAMRFIVTWLPDTDHLRFMSVVAWFDPRLSRGELRAACLRLGEFISRVEADPDSWAERPLWPTGYCELLWDTRHREGHNYTYRPEPRGPEERFGLIIALHGHGGNNRMWLEAWKEFADEFRFAIICPTFGYGNWEQPEGVLVVERSLSAAKQTWYRKIDPERVFLAGISQGGCGVGRAGLELAGCFAGLVFISPTLEPDLLGSAAFQDGWRNRPVLVVSGGKDRHVKLRTVMAGVESMRANGVIVTVHEDPDAGHLLFFAKHGEVLQAIGRWIDHPRGVAL